MKDVVERVKELTQPLFGECDVELVDITYRREQGGMVLRLLVDKEGGITLDECTHFNEKIGEMLDAEDIIADKYILEVNSPGLDRPLKTRRDFERVMGKVVHVHTYEPVNDKRDHEGSIESVDDEKVIVGGTAILLKKISKAKLKIII